MILQETRHRIEQGAIEAFVVQELILCDPLPALTFQWLHDLCIKDGIARRSVNGVAFSLEVREGRKRKGGVFFSWYITFATGSPPIVAAMKMSTKWRPDSARMLLLAVKNRMEPLGRTKSVSSKVSPKERV